MKMGSKISQMSWAMLIPALENQIAFLFKQLPGIRSFQNLATGRQVKTSVKNASMQVEKTKNSSSQHPARTFLSIAIRRYCKTMEVLVRVIPKSYIMMLANRAWERCQNILHSAVDIG